MKVKAIKEAISKIYKTMNSEKEKHFVRLYKGYIQPGGKDCGTIIGLATAMDILCEMIWPHCYTCGKKIAIHEYCMSAKEYLHDDDEVETYFCLLCVANSKKICNQNNIVFSVLRYLNGYPHLYSDNTTKEQAWYAFESLVNELEEKEAEDALISKLIELAQIRDIEGIREIINKSV